MLQIWCWKAKWKEFIHASPLNRQPPCSAPWRILQSIVIFSRRDVKAGLILPQFRVFWSKSWHFNAIVPFWLVKPFLLFATSWKLLLTPLLMAGWCLSDFPDSFPSSLSTVPFLQVFLDNAAQHNSQVQIKLPQKVQSPEVPCENFDGGMGLNYCFFSIRV